MKLTEILNQYNENEDKESLYKNLDSTSLKFSETLEVLRYTLNENFSESDYLSWKASTHEYTPFDCDSIDLHILNMLGYEDWLRENNINDPNLNSLKEDMQGYSGKSGFGRTYEILEDLPKFQVKRELLVRKMGESKIDIIKILDEAVREIEGTKFTINNHYYTKLKEKILVEEKDVNIFGFVQDPLQYIQKEHQLSDDGVFNILREYLIDGKSKNKQEQILEQKEYTRIYNNFYKTINGGQRAPHPDLYSIRILEYPFTQEDEVSVA